MNPCTINIRQIQHYMYCPRRFALLEINQDWVENAFVVKANLMHKNVHEGSHKFSNTTMISRSSVTVYNDDEQYDLFGITDCVEFTKRKGGIKISELPGEYDVKLIEYKPKQPKNGSFHESDAIQVFAQKICVDSLWHCNSEAYLYYADTKKRVKLNFDEEFEPYNKQLLEYLTAMRKIMATGEIPPKRKRQKCSGCSLEDVCFSKKIVYSIREEIAAMEMRDEK